MKKELVLAFIFVVILIGANGVPLTLNQKLIVVLIDGCRWDYINDPNLKGIPRMIENGVKASFVYPIFPALSYPNWYSIVTGLYAENHGFVNNLMYDSDRNTSFLMLPDPDSTEPIWWSEAEPIWITAEKNNQKSALYWWAGCEVKIDGTHPTICERHRYGAGTDEEKTDWYERIDDIIEMFKPTRIHRSWYTSSRLSLALMYYGPVDYNGHYSGPESPERKKAVQDIDEILDKMQSKLKKAGLENEVNIMVVSDHGMTDVSETTTKYIDLEKFSPFIKYQIAYGAICMLVPEDEMLDKLYKAIKDAKITGLHVYKKEDIPEFYHLKNNKRINPILLNVDKGHYIKALQNDSKRIGEFPGSYAGHHGYDPYAVEDMRTIFLATGPAFRKGFEVDELHNVDFYNLMCHILNIQPLPNNGSWDRVQPLLRENDNTSYLQSHATAFMEHSIYMPLTIFIFLLTFQIQKWIILS